MISLTTSSLSIAVMDGGYDRNVVLIDNTSVDDDDSIIGVIIVDSAIETFGGDLTLL